MYIYFSNGFACSYSALVDDHSQITSCIPDFCPENTFTYMAQFSFVAGEKLIIKLYTMTLYAQTFCKNKHYTIL